MKLILALVSAALLGALMTIGGYFFFSSSKLGDESITITFTEDEIQQQIGKKFPKEEKILDFIPVIINEPVVKFLGKSKRVQLSINAAISIPFIRSEDVIGVFTSSIRYEKEDKTLRISDLTVESIETSSLPKKYETVVRTALTLAARQYLDDHIVHQIKPKDYPRAMAEMFLQKIKVKNKRLEVILGL